MTNNANFTIEKGLVFKNNITSERRELSWNLRLKALKFEQSYRHEAGLDLQQQRRVEAPKSEVMNSTPSRRISEILVEFWINTKKRLSFHI